MSEIRIRRVTGVLPGFAMNHIILRRRAPNPDPTIRWLIPSSRGRSENAMEERLSGELLDAANNRGATVKRREDTHRMADANKAFSHYRW